MAAGGNSIEKVDPKKFQISGNGNLLFMILLGLGTLCFVAGLFMDRERAWHSYLVSYFYFASLAVGGLFFTALQHATSAGWSVNIRRLSESFTAFLPVAFVGGLLVLVGSHYLFEWLDGEHVANDPILMGKSAYLNMSFFAVRLVVFTGLWMVFAKKIVGMSLQQDKDGSHQWTLKVVPWSVGFILLFALSYSLFSVDLMMSLQPHWFSTIFGIYCFAGLFQATLAFMILFALYIEKKGFVKGWLSIEHVHDLSKFLKGFTVFWAYIAFSQFMLIWYANLPEETIFYLDRSHGGWMMISMGLLVFKFIVPFVALLPRWAKRTPVHLTCVCILILIMQFVDIYWIVYPNFNKEAVMFSWLEIGVFLGFLGGFMLLVTRFLGKHSLIPVRDPRIQESLDHHVTY